MRDSCLRRNDGWFDRLTMSGPCRFTLTRRAVRADPFDKLRAGSLPEGEVGCEIPAFAGMTGRHWTAEILGQAEGLLQFPPLARRHLELRRVYLLAGKHTLDG